MIIKCFAGIAILIGCGTLGILFAAKSKMRVRQLEQLQNMMMQLEFNIDFLELTLSESLFRIAKTTDGVVKDIFLYIAERLRKNPGSDMQLLWNRAFSKYQYDLALSKEDVLILTDFSKTLGCGSRENEKNNIKVTQMRIKLALDEANHQAKKNVKMYRGLGFLTGIFMIILLI